jgi:type I restriction enzyme M protein
MTYSTPIRSQKFCVELVCPQKSTVSQQHKRGVVKSHEEQVSLTDAAACPETLPRLGELVPAENLAAVFSCCHNYIYANEGLLKEKIFHEMIKLLITKLYDEQYASDDEQHADGNDLRFGITRGEYQQMRQGGSETFTQRINELFREVRAQHEQLIKDDAIKLQPLTLAYVVGQLQTFNLTATPGDIKGEAFQSFIYRHQRGDRGEFFTPHAIVQLAVEMCAPQAHETLIDPACGSGGFLLAAAAYRQRQDAACDKATYIRERLRGIEFNPDVALSATIRLAFEGGTGTEVICANALHADARLFERFDIVLTNPPFGSRGKVEDPRILSAYALAHRRGVQANGHAARRTRLNAQAPEVLFIEQSLRLLRPGGRLTIVLPDGILQNISHGFVRTWLRAQAKVLAVVSIPQEAFIPYGTGIKTSLLLLQKLPARGGDVFMARIQRLGYDVKGQPIYKRDETGGFVNAADGRPSIDSDIEEIARAYKAHQQGKPTRTNAHIYRVPEAHLSSRLDVEHYLPDDQALINALRASAAVPLNEVADILSEAHNFKATPAEQIRYIAISDVDARTMRVVNTQVISVHDAPSRATYRVQEGDIITAVSGASTGTTRQATALITATEDGAICSNGFAVLRNIRTVEPNYLLAFMATQYFLRQVRRLMTGHAIPSITSEELGKVLVPLPPLERQQNIAHTFTSIQETLRRALRQKEQLVSETDELLRNELALYSNLE